MLCAFPIGICSVYPRPPLVGHAGELVLGTLGANGSGTVDLAVMSGRFHLYEGYTARQVASGVRLLHELGVERLVLTNAAGGINPAYTRGALVLTADHINLQGANPLVGANDNLLGPRFPDMTEAYSAQLRLIANETAAELGDSASRRRVCRAAGSRATKRQPKFAT